MVYYPTINSVMNKARGENDNYFQLLTYNNSILSSLLTTAKLERLSDTAARVDLVVDHLNEKAMPKQIYEQGYFVNVAQTPIAMASLDIQQNSFTFNVSQLYVGREYRRNGIGTMLLNICEDMAVSLGYNRMFVNKHCPDSKLIEQIRECHSNVSPVRNFIENITKQNSSHGKAKANVKFLTNSGYSADTNPYTYPCKIDLAPSGYIADCKDNQSDNIVRVNTNEFMDSLSQFKPKCPNLPSELLALQ